MQERKGKLSVIAKTGGIKLEGCDDWINPSKTAKENILNSLDKLRSSRGKEVVIVMESENIFKSIQIVESEKEKVSEPEVVDVESIDDDVDTEKLCETSSGVPTGDGFVNLKNIDECEKVLNNSYPSINVLNSLISDRSNFSTQEFDEKYFEELNKVKCKVDQKNNLNYVSWAHAWEDLKKLHPDAEYKVFENFNGMPYFSDHTGAFVKVSVTVSQITHIVFLPVMNYHNKSVPTKELTTVEINKSIQRALAKGIAMHGLGLYVYRGEDLPEEK